VFSDLSLISMFHPLFKTLADQPGLLGLLGLAG